jgi:hypothetical protein
VARSVRHRGNGHLGKHVLAREVRLAELPDPFIQIWIDGSVRGSMLFGKGFLGATRSIAGRDRRNDVLFT